MKVRLETDKDTPVVRRRDPADMTPGGRLAEVASILAAGYVRILQKRLALLADDTAPCDHAVDGREKGEAA